MKSHHLRKLTLILGPVVALAGVIAVLVWERSNPHLLKPLPYLYEDTKHLVSFVEDAARLVEKRGPEAFPEFAVQGSRWLSGDRYLFVYDLDGVCHFHPITPELVGRSLLDFKDMNDKPLIRWITEIGHRPEPDASDWIFYLWHSPTDLTPTWKSSYIRKVVGPEGKVYLVGSGVHNFKIEPIFVQNLVDQAVALLQTRGKEIAFAHFQDQASRFFFGDTYIYVLNDQGQCLLDPAFPSLKKRDWTKFKDALGHKVVKEMLQRLQNHDTVRVQYMLPKPGAVLPSRKSAYLRKVQVDGETLIIGADFYMATPIWMKL